MVVLTIQITTTASNHYIEITQQSFIRGQFGDKVYDNDDPTKQMGYFKASNDFYLISASSPAIIIHDTHLKETEFTDRLILCVRGSCETDDNEILNIELAIREAERYNELDHEMIAEDYIKALKFAVNEINARLKDKIVIIEKHYLDHMSDDLIGKQKQRFLVTRRLNGSKKSDGDNAKKGTNSSSDSGNSKRRTR